MRLVLVVAAVVCAAWCGRAGAQSDEEAARLDAAVMRTHLGRFWGAVIVTREGRTVLAKGYGVANEQLTPIDERTLFDVGSVAKMFTAAAVLRLEQRGELSLEDPVAKWFPAAGAAAKSVTLRQLLSHTSGIADATGLGELGAADREAAVRQAMRSVTTRPGQTFAYSNAGYVVLAAVLEKASGKVFQEVMREEVFGPAGMEGAGFVDGTGVAAERQSARWIWSMTDDDTVEKRMLLDERERFGWGLKGAGGVVCSARDLAAWGEALGSDRVLSAAARTKMGTAVMQGCGLGVKVEEAAPGMTAWSHDGTTRGYAAAFSYYPAQRVTIAVLTDRPIMSGSVALALTWAVFPELDRAIAATLKLKGVTLDSNRAAVWKEGGSAAAERTAEGRVRVVVRAPVDGEAREVAVATFGVGVASEVAGRLEAAVGRAEREPTGVRVAVYARAYGRGQELALGERLSWMVMPRYEGEDENGQPLVDERICLVLADGRAGFWPVIVNLGRDEAAGLARGLREAARGIEAGE